MEGVEFHSCQKSPRNKMASRSTQDPMSTFVSPFLVPQWAEPIAWLNLEPGETFSPACLGIASVCDSLASFCDRVVSPSPHLTFRSPNAPG